MKGFKLDFLQITFAHTSLSVAKSFDNFSIMQCNIYHPESQTGTVFVSDL